MPPIGIPAQFCDTCGGPMICERDWSAGDNPVEHWDLIRLHVPAYKRETYKCCVPACPEYDKPYPPAVVRS